MALIDLTGVVYGPLPYRTDPEKVAEYAECVGAPVRVDHVPHSLAGALLFAVAPCLLGDPRAAGSVRSVIHGDQTFTWHRPAPAGVELAVSGTVSRVRERGGVFLTGFELEVMDGGSLVLSGHSTFLMAGDGASPGAGGDERSEPPPYAGSHNEISGQLDAVETPLGRFSASRADLVRYAGASRDWNAIHWDHDAAVTAGLPGVVVHGLLQSAWIVEAAVAAGMEPATARFRYRRPLAAAVPVEVRGMRTDEGAVLELADAGGPYVTATMN